jgi:hypothetical protein
MRGLSVFAAIAGLALVAMGVIRESPLLRQTQSQCDHVAWVAAAMIRMQTIKAGMTRSDLLSAFTPEGGPSTGSRRTYVSRDCPYFKVDVEFQAVGRPDRDKDGRVTLVEDSRDVILKVSQPYLQFSILD